LSRTLANFNELILTKAVQVFIVRREEGLQVEKKLLTPKEVCEILSISKTTLYKLVKEGKLTPIKLTKKATRFSMEDIEALIRESRKERSEE